MMNKKFFLNSIIVLTLLFLTFFVYRCKNGRTESDYFNPEILATHFNGEQFVGSASCLECHADIYKTHLETAHYNTSAIADSTTVKGSFKNGTNILDLKDVSFEMRQKGDSLIQHTTIKNRNVDDVAVTFDIVIGSGVKGQSYLTWENDELFQMQTSYYTPLDNWVNSPSFPTYNYTRPIGDACIKCHVTFATNRNPTKFGNQYDKERLVLGIDCERCHRPSAKHVAFHKNNPEEKLPRFAMSWTSLSRQQRLDACAQCHSGLRQEVLKGTPFSFVVGEDLKEYSQNHNPAPVDNSKLDVHGNQYGLLTSSECFKQTATLDCTTCHDPHKNQRGNTDYFNQKCMECHQTNKVVCTAESSDLNQMANNCIGCHMPSMPSKSMTIGLDEDSPDTPFYVRTHLIDVYSEKLWRSQ